MNFKNTINLLISGYYCSEDEAYELMKSIGAGSFTDEQNTALIIALSCRDVSLDEVLGFRKALLELSISTTLEQYDAIDLCGT